MKNKAKEIGDKFIEGATLRVDKIRQKYLLANVAFGSFLFAVGQCNLTESLDLNETIDPGTYGRHYLPSIGIGLLNTMEADIEGRSRQIFTGVAMAYIVNLGYELGVFGINENGGLPLQYPDMSDIACGTVGGLAGALAVKIDQKVPEPELSEALA